MARTWAVHIVICRWRLYGTCVDQHLAQAMVYDSSAGRKVDCGQVRALTMASVVQLQVSPTGQTKVNIEVLITHETYVVKVKI